MTYEQAKDEVAKKHGYVNWDNCVFVWAGFIGTVEPFLNEAAELYANSKVEEYQAMVTDQIKAMSEQLEAMTAAAQKYKVMFEKAERLQEEEKKAVWDRACEAQRIKNIFDPTVDKQFEKELKAIEKGEYNLAGRESTIYKVITNEKSVIKFENCSFETEKSKDGYNQCPRFTDVTCKCEGGCQMVEEEMYIALSPSSIEQKYVQFTELLEEPKVHNKEYRIFKLVEVHGNS
jgi:hypothetical protein